MRSVSTHTPGHPSPECFPIHKEVAQTFIRKLYKNGMLEKRASLQWFDPKINRFLQDRFVRGKCPNPKCDNDSAYSDECARCGMRYEPNELINPRSAISDGVPVLRETLHWWLDMWKVSEVLRVWIQGKKGMWRTPVFSEVINTVLPSLRFDNIHEEKYKEIKSSLPQHKSKYALGKKVMLQFENKEDLIACPCGSSKHRHSQRAWWMAGPIARSRAISPGVFRCPSTLIRTWPARRSTCGRIR